MAIKEIHIEDIGEVRFQKRRGTRSLRIHIQGHSVSVTMPLWVSYHQATTFVKTRAAWIKQHRADKHILANGALIGKQYELSIEQTNAQRPQTRVLPGVIRVSLPPSYQTEEPRTQAAITKACERALAKEAKELLSSRLQDLAFEHDFTYKSLHFKKLKRRWGSCDSQKHIVLNIFLTQLPWELIDYVLLHELTHTQHLHHGADFWQHLDQCVPNSKKVRKELKQFHPQLMPH